MAINSPTSHGFELPAWCVGCGELAPCNKPACNGVFDDEPLDPGQNGPCPGHEFECTGTAYGGDDESFHGEGRCYCIHCGADGDA